MALTFKEKKLYHQIHPVKLLIDVSLKESRLGRYIKKYMTPGTEAIRLLGQIIMWVSAWYKLSFLITIGLLIIIGGWCKGLLFIKNK